MLVVRASMWPKGDATRAYDLAVGTWACVGQARRDDPALGVRAGERAYQVTLFKDVSFGGPALPTRSGGVWRSGNVRGHFAGARGVWDLVGGGLRELLGTRLRSYLSWSAPVGDEHPPRGSTWWTPDAAFRVVDYAYLSVSTDTYTATDGGLVLGVVEAGSIERGTIYVCPLATFAGVLPWAPPDGYTPARPDVEFTLEERAYIKRALLHHTVL